MIKLFYNPPFILLKIINLNNYLEISINFHLEV